jgi:hypothetical protein
MLAIVSSASASLPMGDMGEPDTNSNSARRSYEPCMDVLEDLATLQGPEMFWGSDGPALGFEESDIKGYDGFGKFVEACKAHGIDLSGDITVLAPTDSAFVKHEEDGNGPVTADILSPSMSSPQTRPPSRAAPSPRTASSARTGWTAPLSASSRRVRQSRPTGRRTFNPAAP